MRMRKNRGCRIGALLLLLALPVRGQEGSSPFSLTFDMEIPMLSAAYCPGPLSLVCNPAELAWGDDFEMYFFHQQKLRNPNDENNLSAAGADSLLLRAGGFGLGLQWIRPLEDNDRYNYLKATLGLPMLSIGRWLALGTTLEVLDPTDTAEKTAVDFSAGALLRPLRYVSFGVAGRNLGRAKLAGVRSSRILDLSMAIRPLWLAPEKITLAANLRLLEGADDPPLRFSGWFELLPGIEIFGNVDVDGNFGAGLAVNFTSGGAGGIVSVENGERPTSMILSARMSTALRPGLILSEQRTAQVRLDHRFSADLNTSTWFDDRPTFWEAERAIRRAARDRRVDSLLLRVEDPTLEWSQIEELREAILAFRRSGKKAVVHLRDADNAKYYLASAADYILLDPGGGFFVNGPAVEALFVGGALQMIGARPEFQRVGDYKTAVDMFANDEPSAAHREVLESLITEMDDLFLAAIVEGRRLDIEKARQLLERGPLTGEAALAEGLIDGLCLFDDGDEKLSELLGHRPSIIGNYLSEQLANASWGGRSKIVVVSATGSIAYRPSFWGGLDVHSLVELVAALREAEHVDAVVLRVDSPGGDGAASDMLWQQLRRLREKKPLIVSMGSVAASGGYYISAPADVIVAEPSTITGSIGVFALLFDLSELWADLGISKEILKRSRLADFTNTFRARTEEEMEILKNTVQAFYRSFIGKVAEGRKKTVEEIDQIGQGRVWTGRQAKERGLVDEIGGLNRAIEIAKERLGLSPEDEVEIVFLPRPKFSFSKFASFLGLNAGETDLGKLLSTETKRLLELAALGSGKALAAFPFVISIH